MKKKGFTLVELLAVIAILAILVIIALPNVMGMFNNAKRNTFKTEAEKIYQQITTDFVSDSLKKPGSHVYCQTDGTTMDASVNITAPTSEGDSAQCTNGDANGTTSNKKLNLNTTKNYYAEVDATGKVSVFVVYDNSYYIAFDGTTDKIDKVTDIKDESVKDVGDISSGSSLKVVEGKESSGS